MRTTLTMPTAATKKSSKKKVVKKKAVTKKSVAKTSSATKAPAPGGLLAVGAKALDFAATDAKGARVSLADFAGRPVVLYFYPKDDTPGCTQEACDFRDNLPKFRKLGCTVLGVSPDSAASHGKFASKFKLPFTLLADEPGADGVPPICGSYGAWQEKSMYGRSYMGVARTTYVIAADGTVAARFDKVKVDGHVDEVLAVLANGR